MHDISCSASREKVPAPAPWRVTAEVGQQRPLHRSTVRDRRSFGDRARRFLIEGWIKKDPPRRCKNPAVSPLQSVGSTKVGGEFAVYFDRPPIARVPLSIRDPQLLSLLDTHRQVGTLAARAHCDIAHSVEHETVSTGEVYEPTAIDLEIRRPIAQRHYHRADF
jgi:hypothetical protein